jgi:hypothetical protein
MSLLIYSALLLWLPRAALPLDVPRVTPAELDASPELLSGAKPFILTESMKEWDSLRTFRNMSFFEETFPKAIVDYYPQNLADVNKKPFLRPMGDVLREFAEVLPEPAEGWGAQHGRSENARYVHWRMTASQWNKVKNSLTPMHPFFTTDEPWMRQCIPPKKRHPTNRRKVNWPMNNWIRHTHWKIIVIGEHDSGMFFHADGFSTSTFVFQFVGRKRWTLCPPDPEMRVMYPAGQIDTFDPDRERVYREFERFRGADCADVVVHPGEVIYYPSHYWHQTLNLDRPCVSMAGRRIDGNNAHEVYGELLHRCRNPGPDITKQWPGAAPNLNKRVCKAISGCFDLWKEMFRSGTKFGAWLDNNNDGEEL